MSVSAQRLFRTATVAWFVLFAASAIALSAGEDARPGNLLTVADVKKPTPFIMGARTCATCHVAQNRHEDTRAELESWICEMDQFSTFSTKDKHKLAYQAVTGTRGKLMIELLKFDDAQVESKCVSCHGVRRQGRETQQFIREADGVTCVACHGAYKEWVLFHQIPDQQWNATSRAEKARRFGMTDVWSPVTRAETCASCHIGNHAQEKVLTHAMHAAGHPPLPGFEAASFSNAEPRHWEYTREKMPQRQARIKPPFDPNNLEATQLVVINGLVNLRESMQLLVDETSTEQGQSAGAGWRDFARYDCTACHHELTRGNGASWRQVRRRTGAPGRPTTADWPNALVRLGFAATDGRDVASRQFELDAALGTLGERLKIKPFGDVNTVVPAARALAQWADAAIHKLERTTFDVDRARALLLELCKIAGESPPDYDSARQLAWAFRVIYHDLVGKTPPDPVISRELSSLTMECDLDLEPSHQQALVETVLADRLKRSAEFQPDSFQRHFATIGDHLGKVGAVRTAER